MLIQSQAGEFEIDVKHFEREGDALVMVGAMGVWEARTHVTPRDAWMLLGKLASSGAFWGFALSLPFKVVRQPKPKAQ